MKKNFICLLIVGLLFMPMTVLAEEKPDKYVQTIEIFKSSPVTKKFFDSAYGYAVLPTVGKVGVVIGGSFGKGKVFRNNKVVGNVTMVKISFGAQLGGQAFREIIFLQDKRAYNEFISGSFEFDATASAVAITAGVQATAGTTGKTVGASAGPATGRQLAGKYVKGIAVFIHVRGGLMYEASIGGQHFTFEKL